MLIFLRQLCFYYSDIYILAWENERDFLESSG